MKYLVIKLWSDFQAVARFTNYCDALNYIGDLNLKYGLTYAIVNIERDGYVHPDKRPKPASAAAEPDPFKDEEETTAP